MSTTKVLRGAGLIEVEAGRVGPDVAVVVEGNRIVRVERGAAPNPDGAEVVDLGSLTLMPGLVDAHMHFWGSDPRRWQDFFLESEAYRSFWSVRDAGDLLRAGITSVRCCGSFVDVALTRAIEEGLVTGPRVLPAGSFICQRGGTWDPAGLPEDVIERLEMYADGEDECRRIVRRRIRTGSRVIKLGLSSGQYGDLLPGWGDDPLGQRRNYSVPEVRAMVEEAHHAGVKVSVHAIGDDAVRLALDGDVDTIEHAHGISDETRRRLCDSASTVVPTLSAMPS